MIENIFSKLISDISEKTIINEKKDIKGKDKNEKDMNENNDIIKEKIRKKFTSIKEKINNLFYETKKLIP